MSSPRPARPRRGHLPNSAAARRRRRRRLLLPVGVVIALAGGAVLASTVVSDDRLSVADRFGQAYAAGDFKTMYSLITPADRNGMTQEQFTLIGHDARSTATVERIGVKPALRADGDTVRLPVVARTRLFGRMTGELLLPINTDDGVTTIDWSEALVFPGMRAGETLTRTTTLPPRADLLASDGTKLAEGNERTPVTDTALSSIVGQMGPIPAERTDEYERAGVPPDAFVGLTGLERIFDQRLRGVPGGTLTAGGRTLAETEPVEASSVRTSINPTVQRAAVSALAGRVGGIAVIRPNTGAVMALAGSAFSALQPPGSTFKIVTAAAGLRYGEVKMSDTFPVETETKLSGVTLQNADGHPCGGTFTQTFAQSCNTVFGPLGAKLGAEHLVETAEAFGFNEDPGIPGAQTSSIPKADELGDDDLVLGASAIGQGRLQATALQMALVATVIATRGERPELSVAAGERGTRERVLPREVASNVAKLMAAVVSNGTGGAAKIDGVQVAGKTGTAELRTTQGQCDAANPPPGGCPDASDATDTTAWFAGFAPAGSPRAAIAVQLVGHGQGGATAAPAFREVMVAALQATR